MGASLDGFSCLDPVGLRDQLAAQGMPCRWYGQPNAMEVPAGTASGLGYLLLARADLDALDLDALHDLTLTSQETAAALAASVTLRSLLISEAVCVAPQLRGSGTEPYLVTLRDRRWLLRQVPLDKAYNVRLPVGPADPPLYYPDTLRSGTAWTWQQVFADLWETLGLGAATPDLPAAPSGNPENLAFWAGYALEALGTVLAHCGCLLTLDPLTDTFAVALAGATDAAAAAALAAADPVCVWDDDPLVSDRGRQPEQVRVAFRKQLAVPDTSGASPYYLVDQTNPDGTPAGVEPGTKAVLFDDLAARYDAAGTLLNTSDLDDRAADRAAAYFRVAAQDPLRRVLGRPQNTSALTPGAQITSSRWGDRGRGMVQEARTEPAPAAPPLPAQPEMPETWLQVTSTAVQTATLKATGDTLHVYAAQRTGWDGETTADEQAAWDAETASVWFYGVNGEVPTLDARYRCWLLGVDADGVAIWATEALRTEIAALDSTDPDPATGLLAGSVQRYDPTTKIWSGVENVWLVNANE